MGAQEESKGSVSPSVELCEEWVAFHTGSRRLLSLGSVINVEKGGPKESRAEPPPQRGRAVGTGSENHEHLVVMHLKAPNVWKAVLILQQLLRSRRVNE